MRSRKVINALWRMSAVLLAIYFIFGYKYKIIYNSGNSMHPTYYDGEWIVTKKIYTPNNWKPKRFDIIIVSDTQEELTKRVIGLEGDKILIKFGKIFLNGKELQDPYGKGNIIFYLEEEEDRLKKPKKEWLFLNVNSDIGEVPKGFVWVIGDNREISWYGLVSIKDVKSLVVL